MESEKCDSNETCEIKDVVEKQEKIEETPVMKEMKQARVISSATMKTDVQSMSNIKSSMKEFLQILKRRLNDVIYNYFANLYNISHIEAKNSKERAKFLDLRIFQEKLIPMLKWNTEQVEDITNKIKAVLPSKFDLDETLKMLFIGKCMLLASMRGDTSRKLEIPVPTTNEYIYRLLIIVAKFLFDHPVYLRQSKWDSDSTDVDKTHKVSLAINRAVVDAISDLVPLHHIMVEYMSDTLHAAEYNVAKDVNATPETIPADDFGFEEDSDASESESDESETGSESESETDSTASESESESESGSESETDDDDDVVVKIDEHKEDDEPVVTMPPPKQQDVVPPIKKSHESHEHSKSSRKRHRHHKKPKHHHVKEVVVKNVE